MLRAGSGSGCRRALEHSPLPAWAGVIHECVDRAVSSCNQRVDTQALRSGHRSTASCAKFRHSFFTEERIMLALHAECCRSCDVRFPVSVAISSGADLIRRRSIVACALVASAALGQSGCVPTTGPRGELVEWSATTRVRYDEKLPYCLVSISPPVTQIVGSHQTKVGRPVQRSQGADLRPDRHWRCDQRDTL